MKICFFDTETTGLPLWKEPSESPDQPHIVQLAASLVDADSREVLESINLIAKPDGWTIPDEVSAIHGITMERALSEGVPEKVLVDAFLELHARADLRVGHNESFDARMLRIALKRYGYGDEFADTFKAAPARCTCWDSTPICRLPGKGRGGFKKPKLGEAYEHFFGKPMEGAHTAGGDVAACIAVFFAIEDHNAAQAA